MNSALYSGKLVVIAPPHRDGPRWMGWLVPLECIVVNGADPGSGVVSIAPNLAAGLTRYLTPPVTARDVLPPGGYVLQRFARASLPGGMPRIHNILYCADTSFTPAPDIFPVDLLSEDDIHADWYRLHFDGPVFVARNERRSIVSWAAIKCKSVDIWEMAVATETAYRGLGLARSVVSHATRAALDAGKQPLYLHEISNQASARVCQALGYQCYGYELTCETGRIMPKRR